LLLSGFWLRRAVLIRYSGRDQVDLNVESRGPYADLPLGSRWWRLMAVLLDALVAMVLAAPLFVYFDVWALASAGEQPAPYVLALFFIWGCVSFIAVNGWLLQRYGQTVGKWLLDLAIVGVDGRLQPAGEVLLKRYLPFWIVGQIPVIGGLVLLANGLLIFRSDRRCIHDLIAGTKVVDVGPLGAAQSAVS
jgi:uncharacterized RDD family membrane protein YckC